MTPDRIEFLKQFAKKYENNPLSGVLEEALGELEDAQRLWTAFQGISEEVHRLNCKRIDELTKAREKGATCRASA